MLERWAMILGGGGSPEKREAESPGGPGERITNQGGICFGF